MRFRITSVDYAPPELEAQTPFEAELLREIPGKDRSDYWIAVLDKPLQWLNEGKPTVVTHIIVAARWQGTRIGSGMKQMPIGISYAVDISLLNDPLLDFEKCAYVAIGVATDVS